MPTPRLNEKRWSIDLEKRIQEAHYSDPDAYNARYAFDPQSEREPFVIDTPPPYPSGTWHIGAVAQYSMIDVIARSQRLLGKEVYFPWGVDRNGINIEFTVEKNTKRKMRTYERGEFLDLCAETIETFTQAMRTTAKRVGLSCDFDREYLTDAPDYRSVTQAIFIDLFEHGIRCHAEVAGRHFNFPKFNVPVTSKFFPTNLNASTYHVWSISWFASGFLTGSPSHLGCHAAKHRGFA